MFVIELLIILKLNSLPPNISLIHISYDFINKIDDTLIPFINQIIFRYTNV